jgi:hypothetical protein
VRSGKEYLTGGGGGAGRNSSFNNPLAFVLRMSKITKNFSHESGKLLGTALSVHLMSFTGSLVWPADF